jgi:hypothetical protein
VARELAPARLRSSRKQVNADYLRLSSLCRIGAASQPSGSKLPRHRAPTVWIGVLQKIVFGHRIDLRPMRGVFAVGL